MIRIIPFVIVSTLLLAGSHVLAQKPARSPRPSQKSEDIVYANERASVMPSYRRNRQPSNESVSTRGRRTPAYRFDRSGHAYRAPKPTLEVTSSPQRQVVKTAPVIRSPSRRITSFNTPSPVIAGSSRHITIQQAPTPAAPVIPAFSRHITNDTANVPEEDLQASTPSSIVAADVSIDVAADVSIGKTTAPVSGSPNYVSPKAKYHDLTQSTQLNLQQSQWQPRPKSAISSDEIAISIPDERAPTQPLQMIDDSDLFEIVAPAFSAPGIASAVPTKAAALSFEEESPFVSFLPEAASSPIVETPSVALETGSPAEMAVPLAPAVARSNAHPKRRARKSARASADKQRGGPKSAAQAWWAMLPFLVVPVLALLGWALMRGQEYDQYEEAPAIEIPRQQNSPWQMRDNRDAELTLGVVTEPHAEGASSEALGPETELLDEINTISSIASDSKSSVNSVEDSPAKTGKK